MNLQRRAWPVAVAVSLLVHGALLVLVAFITHQVLRATAPAVSVPAPAHKGPVFRVSVRSASRAGSPTPEPAPPPTPGRPRTLTSPSGPLAAPEPSSPAAAEPGAEPGAEPSAGAGAGIGEATVPGGEGGAQTGGLAEATGPAGSTAPPAVDFGPQVHARLEVAAASCYPAAARRFRQTGTATILFCVDADGRGSPPQVKESSGAALLDAATSCVVEHASPFPLQAAGQCFTVPVRFGR